MSVEDFFSIDQDDDKLEQTLAMSHALFSTAQVLVAHEGAEGDLDTAFHNFRLWVRRIEREAEHDD
jgi:hypothetical protein